MADDAINDLLARRIGLDAGSIGPGIIDRAVRARMAASGVREAPAYAKLLADSPRELQELVELVIVRESWFFRDVQPFELLREVARLRWLDESGPVRALSLPCAGGEEAYSIAITLLEAGLPPARIRVDALDISARAVEHARRGVYGRNAFRHPDRPSQPPYFLPRTDGFEVAPAVRELVHFRQGNILEASVLAPDGPYHAIFCRNLLIYFADGPRAATIALFDRWLDASGLLVIGHAEAGVIPTIFAPRREPGSFAFERASRRAADRAGSHSPPPAPPLQGGEKKRDGRRRIPSGSVPPLQRGDTGGFFERPADRSDGVNSPPPAPPLQGGEKEGDNKRRRILPGSVPPLQRGDTGGFFPSSPATVSSPIPPLPHLDRAAALANERRYAEAEASCALAIRERGPSAAAYFLLGMIRQAAGALPEAEDALGRAVYLDPGHDDALLALALIADRRGDAGAAAAYRRRAGRARSRRDA